MAPSQALIASFSLGSLGRPTESCDQRRACGWGCVWGLSQVGPAKMPPAETRYRDKWCQGTLPKQMTNKDRDKSSEETSGYCSGSGLKLGFHREREKNYESSGRAADPLLLGRKAMKLQRKETFDLTAFISK